MSELLLIPAWSLWTAVNLAYVKHLYTVSRA